MSRHRRRSAGPATPEMTAPTRANRVYCRMFLAMLRAAAPGRINSALMTSSPTQLSDRVTTTAMGAVKNCFQKAGVNAAAVCQNGVDSGEGQLVQPRGPKKEHQQQNQSQNSNFSGRNGEDVSDQQAVEFGEAVPI